MRALPADCFAYFELIARGNTAELACIGAAIGFLVVLEGFAGAVAAAGLAAAPHSSLRKSFHFLPLSVPAFFAAWYFALHSFMVNAIAGPVPAMAKAKTIDATINFD